MVYFVSPQRPLGAHSRTIVVGAFDDPGLPDDDALRAALQASMDGAYERS